MFVHNIDPVFLSIGSLEIRYYGIVYALGFLLLYYALKKHSNLDEKQRDSLLLAVLLGMIIGARVFFFLFYRPDLFSIQEFFAVWNGGMSFHGGFIGLVTGLYFWSKKYKQNMWELADIGALYTGGILFLGRITNFINAEIIGTVSQHSWCVVFPTYDDVCRHPAQLYAAIKNLFLLGTTLALWARKKYTPGFIFWIFTLMYAILRFIVNYWREDTAILLGLKMGQLLSLGIGIGAIIVLYTRYKRDIREFFKKGETHEKTTHSSKHKNLPKRHR